MAVTQTVVQDGDTLTATVVDDAGGGTAVALDLSGYPHKTVQRVSGTGTYTVTGSNDGSTFGALNTAISAIATTNVIPIPENAHFYKVAVSTAAATVVIHASK